MRIVVLGAGAWGCALATLLNDVGHDVTLWENDPALASRLSATRAHAYLGITLASSIDVTADLARAVAGREMVVVATPSAFVRTTMGAAVSALDRGVVVVCAAKGLESETQLTMDRVIGEAAPGLSVALLSGPTFAKEIAAGLPAAVVVAAAEAATASVAQRVFSSGRLRVYTTDDVVGVAIGGALKNVTAIAVGVSDGLGFGDNARAALITRGLNEMARLAVRMGAHPLTISGLAGLGDLVLTCTGDLSRNRQVGLALARGESLSDVMGRLGQVAEGVTTARTAAALAAKLNVAMPIMAGVAAVLYDKKAPREAVADLLSRDFRAERD
ncbi:MAG: NAD(P)-dependent glycerol-3-phosphate dehydrogenase [Deltaproteobacteria bacterium]|nr:NAD(P)-dependent glycerol-3-phosphate dehydrogenase [Deltaproteobacteria bacterium]